MLVGKYEHKIDSANRAFIPAKFREYFPDGFFYRIVSSDTPSIRCFSKEAHMKAMLAALEDVTDEDEIRYIKITMSYGLGECTYDKLGRVVIDGDIVKAAGIDGKCIFQGCFDYFEIFSPENFAKMSEFVASEKKKDEQAFLMQKEKYRQLKSEGAFIKVPEHVQK